MVAAVVDIEIHTIEGALEISWTLEGPPTAVDVATGVTPDAIDHEHQLTAPAGTTTVTIAAPPGARTFVSVAPSGGGPAVVGADRRIPFEGATNFRDLGGYRTADGRRIRWGHVFRADSLHDLTAGDLALYDTLGMRAVYDLRSDVEREERPNPFESTSVVLRGSRRDGDSVRPAWLDLDDGGRMLEHLYLDLVDNGAGTVGMILTNLAHGELPAVFHCHAGKDRTGIVAAVLLLALGVDREVILDDYELTARYRLRSQQESTFQRLLDAGLPPEAAAGVLTTPRWAMAGALDAIEDRGGIEAWLTGPAAVTADAVEALRERLVE